MSFWAIVIVITIYLSIGVFTAGYGLSTSQIPNYIGIFPKVFVYLGLMCIWPVLYAGFVYNRFNKQPQVRLTIEDVLRHTEAQRGICHERLMI